MIVLVQPFESVTESVTLNVLVPQPREVKACTGLAFVDVLPSSKSQAYLYGGVPEVIFEVNTTLLPEQVLFGVNVKSILGLGFEVTVIGPIVVSGFEVLVSFTE